MRIARVFVVGISMVVTLAGWSVAAEESSGAMFAPKLSSYLVARVSEFNQIPAERKDDLKQVADYVRSKTAAGQPARLVFICTHNSRRSHMSQIWATDAASYYGVAGVECFSGGTEATAFNPRAIAALQRTGMRIEKSNEDKNARYLVYGAEGKQPLVCFSKKFSDAPNPKSDFCAVMTCSDAHDKCPMVEGASLRVAIHFADPKIADGTDQETARYDERCAQISREMLYLFSLVKTAAP
jgi:protein-tyrosine-phosphatase